ncbi:MAG: hypothetical protein R6W68_00965 [Ignavibacteriaceae bacterium]
MNKVKIVLVLCLVFSYPTFAQSISVGLGGGVNFISGNNYYTNKPGRLGIYENMNGTTTNLEGMGLTSELQFQLAGKYAFDDTPFNLISSISYSPMRGSDQILVYDFVKMSEVPRDVTAKMDIWSFQVGAAYYLSFYAIKPFITASLSANYVDDFYIEFSEPDYKSEYRSYKNGMRYGYNAGAGIAYNFFSNLRLEVSGNYNSFNLLHSRDGEELLHTFNVLAIFYYQVL